MIGFEEIVNGLTLKAILWALGPLLTAVAVLSWRLVLRIVVFAMTLRLPASGRQYVRDWIESWAYEFATDLRERRKDATMPISAVRRIWDLACALPAMKQSGRRMSEAEPTLTSSWIEAGPNIVEVSAHSQAIGSGVARPQVVRVEGIENSVAFGMPTIVQPDYSRAEAYSPVPAPEDTFPRANN